MAPRSARSPDGGLPPWLSPTSTSSCSPFSLLHPPWREPHRPPRELPPCRASSRRRARNCKAPRRSPKRAAAISSCRKIAAGRGPHHPAHGREIPRPLAGEAARSRCLSRRRAGRHRPAGGQRVHRRRLHPRPRHLCGEPARHHVLGTGADLRGQRQLLQRASRPPLLFRGNQARSFGRDGSLPSGARRHRRRP